MCDADGFLKESKKSDLMNEIEKRTNCTTDFSSVTKSPNPKVYVIDGMVVVHLYNCQSMQLLVNLQKGFLIMLYDSSNKLM